MRIRRAMVAAFTATALTAGVALATHQASGLSSTLQARGAWDRAERTAFLSALSRQGTADTSEVAVVKVSLTPGGYTYWHGHPGPSVVVVTAGAVTVLEPTAAGGCESRTYEAGDAFFHGAGNHDFRNLGTEAAELYITYFVSSWPPLIHTEDPTTCG
jgi:quercetin dioxygenase-like cupin family protein